MIYLFIVSTLSELKKLRINLRIITEAGSCTIMYIMNSIFKANDIRGIYPEELNEDIVSGIGSSLGDYFGKKSVLIAGHDARLSSPKLYKALMGILKSKKLKVIDAGLMTTPMLYFLVSKYKAKGGIMVTASHNPKQYNGLKIVKAGARPVSGIEIGELMVKNKKAEI